ncbi:MAG: outer membrane lipoprotein-sorting protein [Gemmatimonadota bacterium]|nr:outer membrane lipoprotein-sorting protein [Gemmatimonadota bacterium]MDH3480011.1 outer membrane lipoprotein-sorting protein [Gemmatimonadota bacterium]MDH5551637.1 outer membrane lipoprotein-sorting protein [Gemmatimonadota bacterium]
MRAVMAASSLVLAALYVVPALPAQELSVNDVLSRYYEAAGGVEKLTSVMTRKMTGRMQVGPGVEAAFTMFAKRPAKMRMEFTIQGMTAVQAFDGEVGWMISPFMGQTEPEPMPADVVQTIREDADFDGPLIDFAAKGHTIEMVGKEDVQGTEAYKLKLTLKNGQVTYYYLDSESFLPTRTEARRTVQGMDINAETFMSDYKSVDGMMLPFSIQVTGQGPQGQTLSIENVEFNVDIDDKMFVMPEKTKMP